jgi:hypothetical protein
MTDFAIIELGPKIFNTNHIAFVVENLYADISNFAKSKIDPFLF